MGFQQIILYLTIICLISITIRLFLKRKIRTAKLMRWWLVFCDKFHDHQVFRVPELNQYSQENHLFRRVHLYLGSLESLEDSDFTNLFSGEEPNDIVLSLSDNQTVSDMFLGARMRWTLRVEESGSRSFELIFRKRDKRRVLRPYLSHVRDVSEKIEASGRMTRVFSCVGDGRVGTWKSLPFTHPATMETIAMDAEVKSRVVSDVETFLKSKQYYRRVGRVWRRSYLLYGPSGTGKSSFVAALAKALSYDVYNIDCRMVGDAVNNDDDLGTVLLRTGPRSVVLFEDFDKYVGNITQSTKMSTVLNFMDGVTSSCCDERVMVFTATTKDDIAPELLRPGRVDVHIHFPNCDYDKFKNLASNYLGVKDHKLFPQVEDIMSSTTTAASLSPAEVSELMMANRSSPSRAIKSVINAMQQAGPASVAVSGTDSCRTTPKNSLKSGRGAVDGSGELGESGGVGLKDGVKEIKKLYGLLRRKSSSSRVSDSFDLG